MCAMFKMAAMGYPEILSFALKRQQMVQKSNLMINYVFLSL